MTTKKKTNGNGTKKPPNGQEVARVEPEPKNEGALVGFESGDTSLVETEVGAAAAVAREEVEVKAAIFMARRNPRDEAAAYTKLMRATKRPTFAEGARYLFQRGGRNIEGPSVKMSREMARCWGNIRYGVRVISLDADYVHIKGWAFDAETNAYVESEDKFERLIYRKRGGWVRPDERDLRELVNKRGAICVRNSILQIMPPDIVDDMMREVKETMRKAAQGEIEQDREAAIRRMAVAFNDYGVTTEMLREHVGHDLETVTADELTELRGIYTSIRDGQAQVDEFFARARQQTNGAAELDQAAKGGGSSELPLE